MACRFHEKRPTRTQALQRIVETRAGGDELTLGGAVEVRSAKSGGALKSAVLIEYDTGCDKARPGQVVRE
jgi:hypothetical protein